MAGAESAVKVGVNGKKGASWGGRTHPSSTMKTAHSGNKKRRFIGLMTIILDCLEWILYSYDRGLSRKPWKRCDRTALKRCSHPIDLPPENRSKLAIQLAPIKKIPSEDSLVGDRPPGRQRHFPYEPEDPLPASLKFQSRGFGGRRRMAVRMRRDKKPYLCIRR